MKAYPSISRNVQNIPVYGFAKHDGNCVRAEWDRKKKFHKFGSKTQLIAEDQPFLPEAPDLIREKYEKDLSDIFKKERYESATVFLEFYGLNSFAGTHQVEPHTVTLFDINPYKRGILYPAEYLKLFGHLDIAKLLYRGNANHDFVESVKNGTLEGIPLEGVVCKAPNGKTPIPIMFKIKQLAWIEQLKTFCKGDERLFNELL